MIEKFRDPMSALTHLIGAVLSVIGMISMLILIIVEKEVNVLTLISVLAFGLGLIALYTTSFSYHAVHGSPEKILKMKKLDHSMIFFLIAGSYTPFCLLCLTGVTRIVLMSAIWGVAILGVLMMVFWINMPRWLNTGLYIFLGWFAIFAFKPLYEALPIGGFIFLVLGGVMYTVGGIMYGLKKPDISKTFGFHEVFHVFVILGSLCHYYAVFKYILMPIV
ncbi:MAG: hemolysin III family protein [Eubacterium sp.]